MRDRNAWLVAAVLTAVLLVVPSAGATFAGRAGSIAYVASAQTTATHSGDIVSLNPDGSGAATLTSSGLDLDPSYSPDGTRIAFSRLVSGTSNSDIWVMNADGSGAHQLTFAPHNQTADTNRTPSWSPDGSKIAFRGLGNDIWVMNADGSNQVRLTHNGVFDSEPAYSPDGTKIAYVERDASGDLQIWVMDANGANQHKLTSSTSPTPGSAGQNRNPDWSPSGTQIVFWSNRNDASAGKDDLFLMNANGSQQTDLSQKIDGGASTTEDDRFATWSPDGTQIAFRSTRGAGRSLFLVKPDGTGLTRIGNSGDASEIQPSWQARSQADVGVSLAAAPEPVTVGSALTYTVTVRNLGPAAASNVAVDDSLPAGVTLLSATSGCTGTSTVHCAVGALGPSASTQITIVVRPQAPGALVDSVTVTRSELDIDTANDSARVSSTVLPAGSPTSGGNGKPAKCTIVAKPGRRTVRGTPGNDVICGAAGNQTILGLGGDDVVYAGPGNDTIYGGRGNDRIFGGKGNDRIFGGKGNDFLYGGRGRDVIRGGAGNDVIAGGAGSDRLSGGAGDDIVHGGAGNDLVVGGAGRDALFGDGGNDLIDSRDHQRDTLDGGGGTNTAHADPPTVDSSRRIQRFV